MSAKSAVNAGGFDRIGGDEMALVTLSRPLTTQIVGGDLGMADSHSSAASAPEVYEVSYPFVRDVYAAWDADEDGCGTVDVPSWKPGVRNETRYPDECYAAADGIGLMRLTVVSRHTPSPKYRERVFFTREWVDPDGRTFGRKTLRMLGAQAFKRIATSFRVEYEMASSKDPVSQEAMRP